MQDQISATNLAVDAWKKLKEVDSEHELIKYMESPEISDDDFRDKFWDKESHWKNFPVSMVTMRVETNYFLAVKKVLKEKHKIEI